MKYGIVQTNAFKRAVKRLKKQGRNFDHLQKVIDILASGEQLPASYRDHSLGGEWKGTRECHINPDWLLIYRIKESILILELVDTGSHSDLFK